MEEFTKSLLAFTANGRRVLGSPTCTIKHRFPCDNTSSTPTMSIHPMPYIAASPQLLCIIFLLLLENRFHFSEHLRTLDISQASRPVKAKTPRHRQRYDPSQESTGERQGLDSLDAAPHSEYQNGDSTRFVPSLNPDCCTYDNLPTHIPNADDALPDQQRQSPRIH